MGVMLLLDPRVGVFVRGGVLVAMQGDAVLAQVRPGEVDELHVHTLSDISGAARQKLMLEGVSVLFFDGHGRFTGGLYPTSALYGPRLLAQLRFVAAPAASLALAKSIVAGKISNQRAVMLRRQRRLRDPAIADDLAAMRYMTGRADAMTTMDALRGVEGMGAARYFSAFAKVVQHPTFTFPGRRRRPPTDPINAMLSFGYAVLVSKVTRAVWEAGLHPDLGVLHEASVGRASLALDLAEELRPVVDQVVLRLVNRRQVSADDFRVPEEHELSGEIPSDAMPIWLGKVAKEILIRALEDRLDEPMSHPLRGDSWSLRPLLREQALQVARIVEGRQETYKPISLPE